MTTFEVTHLIYSVSDNVTSSHYILHNCQQVALEQLVQPRLGMTQIRQRLDGLKTKSHLKLMIKNTTQTGSIVFCHYLFCNSNLLFSNAVNDCLKNIMVVEDFCGSVGVLHNSANLMVRLMKSVV